MTRWWRPNQYLREGDHEKFAHYVKKDKIMASAVLGEPVIALCGRCGCPTATRRAFPCARHVRPSTRAFLVAGTTRTDRDGPLGSRGRTPFLPQLHRRWTGTHVGEGVPALSCTAGGCPTDVRLSNGCTQPNGCRTQTARGHHARISALRTQRGTNQVKNRRHSRVGSGQDAPSGEKVVWMTAETSQTLDRGLTLLTLLADTGEGMRVSEIAAELGIGRTVVYRLVVTLEKHALLRRAADGKCHVGLGLIGLARQVQPLLREAALPPLRRLADTTTATAHLAITDGADGLVVVAVAEPPRAEVFVGVRVGSRSGLEDSAAGQAVLLSRRVTVDRWSRLLAAPAPWHLRRRRCRCPASKQSSACTSCSHRTRRPSPSWSRRATPSPVDCADRGPNPDQGSSGGVSPSSWSGPNIRSPWQPVRRPPAGWTTGCTTAAGR